MNKPISTNADVAAAMRARLKGRPISQVVEELGLTREAVLAIAAEANVREGTWLLARQRLGLE